ncbi:hypothetical protein EDD22DRAFT_954348 [Suillus occidentalis]|nr:hypothetical protein EDD22DRAFT_954348 [Suillus occidentalis]
MSTVVISRESCYTSLPEFVSRNVGRTNSSQEKTLKSKIKPPLKKSFSSPASSSTSSLRREANSINSAAESPKTSLPTNGNKLNSSTLPATPSESPFALLTATTRLPFVDCDFVSSGRCKDILTFILDSSSNHPGQLSSSRTFSDISADEYEAIAKLVFETKGTVYPKPRLTFIQEKSLLIVEMALPLHEIGITFLGSELALMGGIPFDKRLVNVIVDTNCRRNTPNSRSIFTPDFSVSFKVMRKLDGRRLVQHVALGECALSQDEEDLDEKFRFEVASNPDVELVVKLKVDDGGYESPAPTSEAYKLLVAPKFNKDSHTLIPSAKSHLPLDDFTYLMDPSAHPASVVVAGHTWCSISAVRYQIWVRGENPIDIDVNEGPDVAHGTLFPDIDMDSVDNMIKRGLSRMRSRLAALFQELDPQFDISPITQHNIIFPVSLDWEHCHDNFMVAAEETAHARYIEWYHAELDRGIKRSPSEHDSDSNYVCSGMSQDDDGPNDDDGPSANTRARKKQKIAGEFVAV